MKSFLLVFTNGFHRLRWHQAHFMPPLAKGSKTMRIDFKGYSL